MLSKSHCSFSVIGSWLSKWLKRNYLNNIVVSSAHSGSQPWLRPFLETWVWVPCGAWDGSSVISGCAGGASLGGPPYISAAQDSLWALERQGLRELCQDPGCKKMLVCEVELPRQPGGEAQGEQVWSCCWEELIGGVPLCCSLFLFCGSGFWLDLFVNEIFVLKIQMKKFSWRIFPFSC